MADSDYDDSDLQEEQHSIDEEDGEDDTGGHAKLLRALSKLDRKNRNKEIHRTEPSAVVSDFRMTEGPTKIKVHELLKGLQDSKFTLSKKQLKSAAKKAKVLNVPLPKAQSEKIRRHVAYEKISKDVSKWDSVVNKNRTADCIEFPLNQPVMKLETTATFVKNIPARTPLEMEVARLLAGSDTTRTEDQALTPAEERALKAMSLEEARERLQELRKMRALLSYQELKARRQNKIKSKRYHRILKKDRLKKQVAEFEILKSTNPESALEKLQEIDKRRIEERLTLKHKNTGKWAKHHALRSKYDKQARDALSEQLELSKQLTRKAAHVSSEDEEEEEPETEPIPDEEESTENSHNHETPELPANYNAWLRNSTSLPVPTPAKEFYEPRAVRIRSNLKSKVTTKPDVYDKPVSGAPVSKSVNIESVLEEPEILSESINAEPTDDVPSDNITNSMEPVNRHTEGSGLSSVQDKTNDKQAEEVLVDPTKFIGAKPKVLLSAVPTLVDSDDEGMNDTHQTHHLTMQEAFADDDVLEEFKSAKEDAVNLGKPKHIDLFLPGWGDWGGSGITASKRKRRRFLVKAPPAPPRRDQTLGNVIINEEKESHISKHMVSDLPFPFKSVHQFETSIGHPMGNTWNTQNSFHELIRPEVIVKTGKIIEPMNTDEILKNRPKRKIPKKK